MEKPKYRSALIVGTGPGLSASLARLFAGNGLAVSLAARQTDKLAALAKETGADGPCLQRRRSGGSCRPVRRARRQGGARPTSWSTTPATGCAARWSTCRPTTSKRAIEISAFGGFLVSQQAARRMLPKAHGAIFLTGATAGVKGFALSATFAMGKFALRGLAQSMARELSPQGIHVAHFVIDGGIRSAARPVPGNNPDSLLDPDAIAETYWATLQQHRSAWSWEVEVRPWVEKF